jgi:hypothetical protein
MYSSLNVIWVLISKMMRWVGHMACTRHVQKVKIHHVQADREIFYAYCGNTAINLDPLPAIHARVTVVEPALFE